MTNEAAKEKVLEFEKEALHVRGTLVLMCRAERLQGSKLCERLHRAHLGIRDFCGMHVATIKRVFGVEPFEVHFEPPQSNGQSFSTKDVANIEAEMGRLQSKIVMLEAGANGEQLSALTEARDGLNFFERTYLRDVRKAYEK